MYADPIFEPKSDDKFAAASPLVFEVATLKESGYLQGRGVVPEPMLETLIGAVKSYYAEKGRPEPVIYTRVVGAVVWVAQGAVEIPDELPADFQ